MDSSPVPATCKRPARLAKVSCARHAHHACDSARLRQRPPATLPAGWCATQRATYYFDATWHTAQTLRRLVRANHTGGELGVRPPSELLSQAMQSLLHSICPGLIDDQESLNCFNELLRAHLTGLDADEILQLADLLKAQRFDCVVAETVIDDPMILKFGFANGPPHQRMRTLMYPPDLHNALDEVRQAVTAEVAGAAVQRLSSAQASDARDALAMLAARYATAGLTLDTLAEAAIRLAQILGRQPEPVTARTASGLPPSSSIDWQDERLLIDERTFTTLVQSGDRDLYASTLRDLLELVLARRRYGPGTTLLTLPPVKRAWLFREVEQVLSLPPTVADRSACARGGDPAARHPVRRRTYLPHGGRAAGACVDCTDPVTDTGPQDERARDRHTLHAFRIPARAHTLHDHGVGFALAD